MLMLPSSPSHVKNILHRNILHTWIHSGFPRVLMHIDHICLSLRLRVQTIALKLYMISAPWYWFKKLYLMEHIRRICMNFWFKHSSIYFFGIKTSPVSYSHIMRPPISSFCLVAVAYYFFWRFFNIIRITKISPSSNSYFKSLVIWLYHNKYWRLKTKLTVPDYKPSSKFRCYQTDPQQH